MDQKDILDSAAIFATVGSMTEVVTNLDECIEFENARHPLTTYESCKARAMEMANDINRMTQYKAIAWKCLPIKHGTLT